MQLYLLMSPLFGIGGLIILSIAISIHRSIIEKRNRATAHTDARVVEMTAGKPPIHVYEFSANGMLWRAKFAGKHHTNIGDVIPIYYDPDCPEIIYIPENQPWAAIIALYFIGIMWLFSAIMLLIFWKLGIK